MNIKNGLKIKNDPKKNSSSSQMLKILFVSEYFPPIIKGGGEINLHLLAKTIAKQGHDVSVLTSYHRSLPNFQVIENIKVYRNLKTGEYPEKLISNLKRALILPKSIEHSTRSLHLKEQFDIIHFIGRTIIAARSLRCLRVPLFATIESYPALCPKGDRIYRGKKECAYHCSFSRYLLCQHRSPEMGKMKNRWYLKNNPLFLLFNYHQFKLISRSLKYCNLISISRYIQKLLTQHGFSSTVIPNSLEIMKFSKLSKLPFSLSSKLPKSNNQELNNQKLHLLYLGSLTKFKGPQVLLKAIKGLPEMQIRCSFYGDGPLKGWMEDYIRKNSLPAEIFPPVPYENIPTVYSSADIIIFPSIWPEPFGRIAIEAAASGKPIIGSEIGGISETLDLLGGIRFPPGDYQALRRIIFRLIKEHSSLNSFNGLSKIKDQTKKLKRFEPDPVADQTIKEYLKQIKTYYDLNLDLIS
jgi:glycosyltransferase involved in cell wall biosynthesis